MGTLALVLLGVLGQVPSSSVAVVAPEPIGWLERLAGSQLFLQNDVSVATLAPGLQLSPNPTVETTIFLLPRFRLADDWQLRGRLALSVEWTDSDVTNTRRKPQLSDTTLQLYYGGLPSLLGIKTLLGAQVVLPSSDASTARTLRLAPGALLQLSRAFPVPGGSLLGISSFSYQRPLYAYTTPGLDEAPRYAPSCRGDLSSCVQQASGLANARDLFGWSVALLGVFGDWSPALTFSASHQIPFGFSPVPGLQPIEDPTTVRVVTAFSAFLDWSFNAWGTAEFGYYLSRNVLGDDGRYGNPIFDRRQDGRLYLGLNVALDQLWSPGGSGGVVRQ